MSVDLANIRPALKSWVAAALGTTPDGTAVPVVWEEETDKVAPRGVIGRVHVRPIRGVGRDRVEHQEDPGRPVGEDFVPHVLGTRELTLTVSVEGEDARAGRSAFEYIERLRTKLRAPSTIETFVAAGVSLSRAENPQEAPFTSDGRRVTKAMLDVHFYAQAELVDSEGATSWIETVEVTDNELQEPDGSRVPPPLQFNQETLP